MRMIDADTLKDNMFCYAPPEMTWDRGDIEHKIDEMPTVEPKRGRWLRYKSGNSSCSECGEEWFAKYKPNYCPNCGAKMEGGENND